MSRALAVAVLLTVGLGPAGTARALTIQEAILRAKPAVALVTAQVAGDITMNCGTGPVTVQPPPFIETGTGWFIDGRGWLVTNAHVVDPAHRLPSWVTHELKKKAIDLACVDPALRERGLAPGERPDVEDRIRRAASERGLAGAKLTTKATITVMLPSGVTLPAEVKKFSAPLLLDGVGQPVKDSGRDLALLRVPDGVYPAMVLTERDTKVGDSVHILGFPGVVLTHELLKRSTMPEASVTNGFVSGFKVDLIGQDMIQTDAPAAHGNSGGPAITDDASVVGVMTFTTLAQGSGSIVQGFNFLIPTKDVRAFLQDTPVKPGDSKFNTAWIAGLTALFSERYATAVARLTEANRLVPNLPDVKKALAEADRNVKNPPPRPFPWAWATLGVTLLSASGFGGLWAQRWWKNRFRIQPTQVIALIEKGESPLMVDVRSGAEYETSPLKLPAAVRLSPEDAAAGRIQLQVEPMQLLITYCSSPGERTSAQVTQLLRQRGYRNVRILKGGLGGWTNARLPVESKSHLPSIGLEIYKNLTVGDVERRTYAPEQVIFREGDDAHDEAYVVHAGTVEIRKRIEGTERVLAKYGEGELFGEVALFRKAPRSADAVATSDVEVLVIKSERLDWLIRNRPQLTMEVLKRLSDTVVRTDADRLAAQSR
jgi:S1-C subfamily serine protease/rhodanese-related sulfurtransferase